MTPPGVDIPAERVRAAREIAALLAPGRRVVLTTHVNADGDGVGSEVGLWHLLAARGVHASIANPTEIPDRFGFLLPEGADQSGRAGRVVEHADVVVVMDISDLSRLGDLGQAVKRSRGPTVCIDHHVPPLPPPPRPPKPARCPRAPA
ncbi:MAG: DHH family phosphoesterase [Gemmatimonadales bacterium]